MVDIDTERDRTTDPIKRVPCCKVKQTGAVLPTERTTPVVACPFRTSVKIQKNLGTLML